MQANHREEIAASVAAQQALGPAYDQALAEGLVERIGDEIDSRIAAQVDRRLAAEMDEPAPYQADPHLSCRHMRRAQRQAARAGRPSVLVPLGSLAAAILASLTVLLSSETNVATGNGFTKSGPGGAAFLLTALIWIIIGVINVTYARRRP
ncbi:MAG TPA: hypothetical protein VHY58_16550 [Streptosporangiaceae bacterium]|jgi:hypothetical protein|nr:hypothetical protein [Streptosporangiaceae bacterium]